MEKGSGTYNVLDTAVPCMLLPATAKRTTAVPLSSTGNRATGRQKDMSDELKWEQRLPPSRQGNWQEENLVKKNTNHLHILVQYKHLRICKAK